jgi:tetratricopeptide (TPR) repeat protein
LPKNYLSVILAKLVVKELRQMNETEIKYSHNEICKLLADRKLKPAFDLLEKMISANGLGEFSDQQLDLEQNYRFMLKYTVEGISDPERQKIYQHILLSTFELADSCADSLKMKFSSSLEYQKKRGFVRISLDNIPDYFAQIESFHVGKELQSLIENPILYKKNEPEEEKHHQKLINLFYHYWFRNKLSVDEVSSFKNFLNNQNIPTLEKAFLIIALTLGQLHFFDEQKIMLLFEGYDIDEEEVNQRSLTGLLLSLFYYDQRIFLFPAITGRLALLNERISFRQHLEKIILQLIGSKETEKIQRKLQDEILPEMMKLSPNLRNKLSLEAMLGDLLNEDKNPEWQDILKDSPGFMDKMEELSEMQMKGADIFMTSFANLKNFPFFSELTNWFVPFYPHHPYLLRSSSADDMQDNQKLFDLLLKTPVLCNSDKYSFCFSMQTIPPDYKKMMFDSLSAEFDQLIEAENEEDGFSRDKKAEAISGQYIRDLYRFCKLHPQRHGMEDIFSWSFDFHNKKVFQGMLYEDNQLLRNIAEFYFAKDYYKDAAEIYAMLLLQTEEAELIQKLAFCHQKMENFELALSYYLKADLFDQNRIWNHKKIALCYRHLKNPEQALNYYLQVVALEPENLGIHISIGHCRMELKQYDEALKSYFKVEYLSPGNKRIWRPIGWCSLLVGKKQLSEQYFRKLVEDSPNKFDLMNMGHVQWCMGKRKMALDFYKQSINDAEMSEKEFMESFNEDLEHLLQQGVESDDVPIMLDQLRYALEKDQTS